MMAGGQIVTIGKDDFYRDVSVFIDRLDDIVNPRGGEAVRNNLVTPTIAFAAGDFRTPLTIVFIFSLSALITRHRIRESKQAVTFIFIVLPTSFIP